MSTARQILHVDMDAFFASVEQRDDPALRGKPVLVGGGGPRGVVAAASYEARAFGCHSALPTAIARRRCPQAIIVPVRGGAYREASRAVFSIFGDYTPLVQPLSLDEAFLDVSGSVRLHGDGETIARTIRKRISDEVRLTASVGVAPNKFLAKLASDLDKPDGLTIIPVDRVAETIEPLALSRMWGVGPALEARLERLGLRTFGDLQRADGTELERHIGPGARRLITLSRGEDAREVIPDGRARSISQERTFGHDIGDPEIVSAVLLGQVEQVARRLRRIDRRAGTVIVKIRFGDYRTITRSHALDEPTNVTQTLWHGARDLFDRWAASSFEAVRLVGFAATKLCETGDQLHLFDADVEARQHDLDVVTDEIRTRFGEGAIQRAARRNVRRRDR